MGKYICIILLVQMLRTVPTLYGNNEQIREYIYFISVVLQQEIDILYSIFYFKGIYVTNVRPTRPTVQGIVV